MERLRRSMLFIPGNNPNMLQNAGILGADSVILDVEDAVSINEKDSARILIRNALKNVTFYDSEVIIRVNALSTKFGLQDIEEIAKAKPHGFMIPKATEEDIQAACDTLSQIELDEGIEAGSIGLIPIIETAYSVENISSIIKASNRISAVLLGAEDLTADLGIKRTREGEEIFYARNKVAIACRAYKVDAIDTPFADVSDLEGLIQDTHRGKNLGMTGKAAINPRQVDTIHSVFAPTEEEIRYACRVIEAMDEAEKEGKGVFSLDGKMIDAPIILRAQNVMKKATLAGLI